MDVQTLTIKPWGILAQGASANERWQWMREFQGTGVNAKMVFLGLVVALVLALLALLVYMMYKRFVEAKKWEQFNILSEQTGLRGEDLQLLTRAVKRAGLKDPAVVFSDADAYNTVATDFMFSPQVFSYPAKVQIGLQALLASMHAKLGYGPVREGGGLDGLRSTRQLPTGTSLFVVRTGDLHSVEAKVIRNSETELLLSRDETLASRRSGDALTIRYARKTGSWEFDAPVIRCDDDVVAVEHSEEIRPVNFRIFQRVSTSMFAIGVPLEFHVPSCKAVLEFAAIEIVEIAGPGLLLDTKMELEVGHNMLIRVRLEADHFVQGIAKVRRVITDDSGRPLTAVEFIELSDKELAEMASATNRAARHRTAKIKPVYEDAAAAS